MTSKKTIQFLRGTLEKKNNSDNFLAKGQPLYITDTNQLCIGGINEEENAIKLKNPITVERLKQYRLNKDTNIVEETGSLEFANGKDSFTTSKSADSFTYTNNTFGEFNCNVEGIGSVSLSQLGRITRNHTLEVGNLNVIENSELHPTEDDDGNLIIGYKNYSNSRTTSLFGAWNRAIDTKASLISGYKNTVIKTPYFSGKSENVIISGQNNFVERYGNSATFGYGLINKWTGSLVTGVFNNPKVEDLMEEDYPVFSIGNGSSVPQYSMVEIPVVMVPDQNGKAIASYDGKDLTYIIQLNKAYKETPTGEGLYFSTSTYNLNNLILNKNQVSNGASIYKRVCNTRSNAFVITEQGRALLKRGHFVKEGSQYVYIENNMDYASLSDTDILTKKEIDTNFIKNIKIEGGVDIPINNGVAAIPLSVSTQFGVSRTYSGYGIQTGTSGALKGYLLISKATNNEINNKTNNYKPIVPSNLDDAVKVSITTNKNALTNNEQVSVQKWLGLNSTIEDEFFNNLYIQD